MPYTGLGGTWYPCGLPTEPRESTTLWIYFWLRRESRVFAEFATCRVHTQYAIVLQNNSNTNIKVCKRHLFMYVPTSALQVRGLARRRAYAVHRGPQRARARARPHTTSLRPRKSEEEKRTCCTATSSRVSTAVREVVFPVSRETLALGLTVGGPIDWLSTGRVLWAMLWRQGGRGRA